jgi:RNA polymerase sigma-70 factor (ECF subfamily)
MHSTLAELLALIQSGDETGLLALHEQYAGLVYSVAYRVLNDQMTAEEVTQDTFMRLWNKAELYDPRKGSFVTWLLTITRRIAIDVLRKQQRDPVVTPAFQDDDSDRWETMLGADENVDLRRTLAAVMQELPNDQRHAIELAYFQGMSHSQIADYLDQPVGTIKTRIRLGMKKLREAWLGEPVSNPNQDN